MRRLLVLPVGILLLAACSDDNRGSSSSGGAPNTSGGSSAAAQGGVSGSNSVAGAPSQGGSGASSGGMGNGGAPAGGAGGSANNSGGKDSVAGSSSGGTAGNGSATGGSFGSGGANSGGAPSAQGGSSGSAGRANSGGSASAGTGSGGSSSSNDSWVGTWVTAQQLVEEANKPPSPGLSNNTLRQIVHVSIGGTRLRLRFSNEYGTSPVTLKKVHVATSAGTSAITASTDKELSFGGSASVTIAAKQAVVSDAFDFALMPLSNLAVSIAFGTTSNDITGHPGSRTTSFIATGDAVSSATLSSPTTTDHWYILSGIDVAADSSAHALVALGDSITDGRGSTTNGNDRWPDLLAKRLQNNTTTAKIGMLNQGIGGNTVLSGGLGPTATSRFDGDVLKQSGVRWLIVFEGVNDIGNSSNGASTASSLINAYKQFVSKAHGAGLKAFGATITPFNGNSYYSTDHESARKTVNEFIRGAGNFDALIDFDAAVRDPSKQDTLLKMYDSGDGLHLNPTGYQKLADTVDLALLAP